MQCHQALQQRAVLRSQHSRLLQKIAACNVEVEESMMTSERLNSCLSELEEAMRRQKDAYEKAVESRNVTGVQLIDRGHISILVACVLLSAEPDMEELLAKEKELQQRLNAQKVKLLDLQPRIEELDEANKTHAASPIYVLYVDLCIAVSICISFRAAQARSKTNTIHRHLDARMPTCIHINTSTGAHSTNEQTHLDGDDLYSKTESGREVAFELIETLGTLQQRLGEISKKERCLRAETIMYKVTKACAVLLLDNAAPANPDAGGAD
ncbi:uncharacterized protein LOC34622935 [Cyclospora cayetanensis]|uniref:Uncharacterized protein LOC34622935 n=1 Tax=Cyclospora cayetanensis TaxID=88456 RepID=A0A6P6S1M2_9EIME|nr:uncharacterized protein LOC34622935 [Cyclospora cayetanensis]